MIVGGMIVGRIIVGPVIVARIIVARTVGYLGCGLAWLIVGGHYNNNNILERLSQ
jgi:hypothetical protein